MSSQKFSDIRYVVNEMLNIYIDADQYYNARLYKKPNITINLLSTKFPNKEDDPLSTLVSTCLEKIKYCISMSFFQNVINDYPYFKRDLKHAIKHHAITAPVIELNEDFGDQSFSQIYEQTVKNLINKFEIMHQ